MRQARTLRTLLLLAALIARGEARADEVVDGIRRCQALAVEADRLQCYDTLAQGLDTALADRFGRDARTPTKPAPAAPAAPAASVAPVAPVAPPAQPVAPTPSPLVAALPTAAPAPAPAPAPAATTRTGEPDTLSAHVSALRQGTRGEWIFTLDNGQVWAQVEPRAELRFSVGDEVRLTHGMLGSLWLEASQHRQTKVRRLR
jgi:hypothetical protein